MKKEYFGIIYKATFSNGKCYIGQTTRGLSSRKRDHITSAGTENVAFHNAINKYGKEDLVWEVIDTANSIEELNEKEFFWIDYYNSYTHLENSNGYNMTLGGNSTLGWIPTDETKEKISKANTGNFAGEKNNQYGKTGELSTWWGRKHTEEEKRKISESNKGKIISSETREKISKSNKGKTKGVPKAQSHRDKISLAKMGHSVSDETRRKISETHKKNNKRKTENENE